MAITKDTVYVASYYSPGGYFPFDQGYFTTPHDGGMLTALAASETAATASTATAPARSRTRPSTPPTTGSTRRSTARCRPTRAARCVTETVADDLGAATSTRDATVTATFDEQLTPGSLTGQTFTLRGAGGALVPATVSYDAQTRTAKLDPHGAARLPERLHGHAQGRRRRRRPTRAGNPLAADKTWSFTVAGQSPAEGPGGPILRAHRPGRQVRHLLRGDPPQRGPEQLRGRPGPGHAPPS